MGYNLYGACDVCRLNRDFGDRASVQGKEFKNVPIVHEIRGVLQLLSMLALLNRRIFAKYAQIR